MKKRVNAALEVCNGLIDKYDKLDDLEYKNLLPSEVEKIFSKLKVDDYPPLQFNEWIKLMHKYGGMHGSEIALKKIYLENKKIIKDKPLGNTIFYNDSKLKNDVNIYQGEVLCVNSDLITEYKHLLTDNYFPVIINVCNKFGNDTCTVETDYYRG